MNGEVRTVFFKIKKNLQLSALGNWMDGGSVYWYFSTNSNGLGHCLMTFFPNFMYHVIRLMSQIFVIIFLRLLRYCVF